MKQILQMHDTEYSVDLHVILKLPEEKKLAKLDRHPSKTLVT